MIDLILGNVWPYVIGALTAIAGVAGVYFKGRADAKAKRKADEAARTIETLQTAREVKADVDETSDDDVRRDLRKWMRRDE